MLLKQQAKDMKSAENRLNERTDCERGPPLRGRVEPREEPKEEEEEKSLSRSSLRGVLTGEDKGRENEETFEREISSSSLSLSASLPQRSSITERCGDRRNHLSLAATKDEKNAMEDRKASSVIDRVEEKKSKKKVALVHVHQYTVEDGYSTQPVVLNKHVTNTMT
ncbi:hypothetical protein CSUI_010934 [Cystoisospora suis]|uniref:Uncharacterized protein n=1 Tax=Cystoisospora suis TaxID=483139 RepID=A0A2C6KFZ4_9APIC|nr:hypothetical protein CSUI_010934 [Cystoisospora suis]